MSKKSLVALAHGLDVQENVTRVFDMMGGAAKMIEPNSTVVLKPNAGHAAPPEFAVCTHPETVRAVIREVKKANPKRIVIAEAAGADLWRQDRPRRKRWSMSASMRATSACSCAGSIHWPPCLR